MAHDHEDFVPAAGHDWLLPLYDPLNRLLGAEKQKRLLIEQAGLRPGMRVLDVGCGTGSVSILAKRLHPEIEIVGLDPDPRALSRARQRARVAGVKVGFEQGYANELPFPDASFERGLSSLMLHHLDPGVRVAALRELSRVIVPGGSVHVLDFGPPSSRLARTLTGLIHRGPKLRDNLEGRIPWRLAAAGFENASEVAARNTAFGTLCFYTGTVPDARV